MAIKQMINSIREHMNRAHPVKSGRNRAAAFATAEDVSCDADGSADTTVQGSKRDASSAPDGAPSAKRNKRKPARKGSAKAHSTSHESRATLANECPVCGSGTHELNQCWSIHKDPASSWFSFRQNHQDTLERLQKHDTTFRKLIRDS
ncbi:hypothetical protein E4U61_006515 [Claviceps capensis]|nr:hypothetical protein E4U61_006515 [Claviceps capensis]